MGQQVIDFCDICKSKEKVSKKRIPIIFTTEETEGRSCEPYLTIETLDICENCYKTMIDNSTIPNAHGAQGYNTYYLKNRNH